MDKVLSIIVPTFNMEKYLDKCLSSLIVSEEKMRMLEVLVVNDGSKDKSSEIAHGYEYRYPGVFHVIDKDNGHYGSCVNRGLSEATGKYVKVLDADDWFETDNLEDFLIYLSENDSDLFISESCILRENNIVSGEWKYLMKPSIKYNIKDFFSFSGGFLCHQILTYRRHLLLDMHYSQTEGVAYTDLEWVFKPMASVSTFMYFPKRIYVYFQARGGQSVSPEIHCRNIGTEQGVIMKLINSYESQSEMLPEENRKFMHLILAADIRGIYHHYLLDYPNMLSNENLVSFDEELFSASPELYNMVADASELRRKINIRYY